MQKVAEEPDSPQSVADESSHADEPSRKSKLNGEADLKSCDDEPFLMTGIINPFDIDVPIEIVLASVDEESSDDVEQNKLSDDCKSSPILSRRPTRMSTKLSYTPEDQNNEENTNSPKENLILKTSSIKEDIENGRFPEKLIEITRGKGLQLKTEEATEGVYKKKCGFRTTRPLVWAETLEAMLESSRWDYTEQDNKYTQCSIKVPYLGSMVTVDLKFDTGIIFIAGGKYEQWVKELFGKWKSASTNEIISQDQISPPQQRKIS